MPDRDDASPKLFDVWHLVLARGLVEGALLLLVFFGAFYEIGPLTQFVTAVLLGGSVIELVMARRLRGHAFHGILVFIGLSGLLIAGFVLYNFFFSEAIVTLNLLVVIVGLWVAVRGFAALWLGLSIVAGTFERAVPVGAGLLGLAAGFLALLFFSPREPTWLVRLLSLYGVVSLVVHGAVAFRIRRRGRQRAEKAEKQERAQGAARGEA